MEKYSSAIICILNDIMIALVLGVLLLNSNINIYKTSLLASFLFFIIFRNFYQNNNLYNFIHNKTINI